MRGWRVRMQGRSQVDPTKLVAMLEARAVALRSRAGAPMTGVGVEAGPAALRAADEPAAAGTIVGRIVDANTRSAVRSAVVEISAQRKRVLTDSSGHFAFAGVPGGKHRLAVSALGYEKEFFLVAAGRTITLDLRAEPVPLAGITAQARSSQRNVRGVPLRIYGREDLANFDDVSAATFVHEKAHVPLRPCESFTYARQHVRDARPDGGGQWVDLGTPPEWRGEDCIQGLNGRPAPVIVTVDGQRIPAYFGLVTSNSSALSLYRVWDLARVEVMFSRAPGVAVVRLFTTSYLARQAAHLTGVCDQPLSPRNARLAALCELPRPE